MNETRLPGSEMRIGRRGIFPGLIVYLALIYFVPADAHSFTTSGEFIKHSGGASECASQQCHPEMQKGAKPVGHRPSADGQCGICHKADQYPARFGLSPERTEVCTGCHRKTEHEVQTSQFVHGPLKSGDCTACHDPHGSAYPFVLREQYNKICFRCHSRKGLYSGSVVHKPVEDGNCGICHDPHASDRKARLTDTVASLCLSCHDDMMSGMTNEFIHAPLLKEGCSACHDPHAGNDRLRLRKAASELCFSCHVEKKNEIGHYTKQHKPAVDGQCASCHSPHFSSRKYLLRGAVDGLCYACHKDKAGWAEQRFRHGPLVQGNCSACHNPHGSDYPFILRLSFPYEFYSAYERGKYDLCFVCHKEALITSETTTTATNFRNGEKNLHWFHVKQAKGRTCRACHDIHSSDQEFHIRDEFPFGNAAIPMEYRRTPEGGSCLPGCHKERKYDRAKAVSN